jgi:hypothetical protein
MTQPPEFMERIGQRAFYRPIAEVGFAQALDLIGAAWLDERGLRDSSNK